MINRYGSARRRAVAGKRASLCTGIVVVAAMVVAACGGDDSNGAVDPPPVDEPADDGTADEPADDTAAPDSDLPPFQIGYTDAQTGAIGPGYLGTGQYGLSTYLGELNERGGVHGRLVEVQYLDDRTDGSVAVTNFRQLADSDAIAIIGSSVSSFAAGQAPLAEEAEITLIAGGVPDELMDPVQPWFFSTNLAHTGSGQIQLDFAISALADEGVENPRAATFIVDTAAGREKYDMFVEEFEALGWEHVASEFYDLGDTDVSAQVAQVDRAEPDIVFGLIAATDMATVGSQMAQRGVDALIINSYAGADEPIFEALDNEKFLAPRAFVWPSDPEAEGMAAAAETAGVADQMVSNYFTRGYVLGMLIEETLERCGVDCDRAGFRDALESVDALDTGGLSGQISFGPDDHLGVAEARMFRWNSDAGMAEAISDWIPGPCCGRW